MKLKKLVTKAIALSALALSITSFSLNPIQVSAATVHETVTDSMITPFAQICGNCGIGQLIETKNRGSWYVVKEVKCSHGYAYGTDIIENRSVTVTIKCNTCGIGYSYAAAPDERTLCHGFN